MNKKNWYGRFDKNTDFFLILNIDINGPDTSDVILYESTENGFYFINGKTGKQAARLEDVVRDRRFLLAKNGERGFYAKHIKEWDMLLIVSCELSVKDKTAIWVEKNRYFIAKNGRTFDVVRKNELVNDICGQSVIKEILIGSTPYTGEIVYHNYYSGAKEEILDFFGGITLEVEDGAYYLWEYNNIYQLADMFMKFYARITSKTVSPMDTHEVFLDGHKEFSCIYFGNLMEYDNGNFKKRTNRMPIPDKAYEKMQKVAKKWIDERYGDIRRIDNISMPNVSFEDRTPGIAIIQNIDGRIMERCFVLNPILSYDNDSSSVIFSEYLDVYLDSGQNGTMSSMKEIMACVVVWIDDNVKDTMLEHTAYLLRDTMDLFFNKMESGPLSKAIYDLDVKCSTEYGVALNYMMPLVMEISLSPFVEMAFNTDRHITGMSKFLNSFNVRLAATFRMNAIVQCFGFIDENKKKFHEMLMMPKGMFEYLVEKGYERDIPDIKDAFHAGEEKYGGYFERLDKNSYKAIVENAEKADLGADRNDYWENLSILTGLFGIENWRGYMRHMNALLEKRGDWITFCNYLDTLNEMKYCLNDDIMSRMQWKLKGEALEKSNDAACDLWAVLDYGNLGDFTKCFKDRQQEWQKFCFEKDELAIIAPRSPIDLIEEGVTLKHCAKEFIPNCADGETVILFIRKKKELTKPYYTIEIRDNKVRQCHGMSNRNIGNNEKLVNFIKNFCEDKKIEFYIGSDLLGADVD